MISPAGLASPLLLLVGYVGTAVGHRESYSLFLHNNVDLNVLGHKTLKLRQFYSVCLSLRLTVTVGEVDEAAGAGVAVLSAVVRFAEAATGPILTGSICELGLTVAACREAKREKKTQNMIWYEGESFNVSICDLTDSWDSREQASGDSMGWSGDL